MLQSYLILLALTMGLILDPKLTYAQIEDPSAEKRAANLELALMNAQEMLKQKTEELKQIETAYQQLKGLLDFKNSQPIHLKKTKYSKLNLNALSQVSYQENAGMLGKQKIDLKKKQQQKLWLLNLWATWCKPCISAEEQAYVRYLEKQLKEIGVSVIAMAVDEFDRLKENPTQWYYPLYHLKNAPLELFSQAFVEEIGLILPLFILISEKGEILYYLDRALNEQLINELMMIIMHTKLGLAH
jgi:thiol-disulfide isomerase/thioredoxin